MFDLDAHLDHSNEQKREHGDHDHRADKSPFFSNDTEDKIRRLLGHVGPLRLRPFHESLTGQTPRADGRLGLHKLKTHARPEFLCTGIRKRKDASHLMRTKHPVQRKQYGSNRAKGKYRSHDAIRALPRLP